MEIARKTDGKARENFSRQSELIIGAPYYPPGTAEGILNDWHATFQDLCVSACAQQKTKIAVIVAGAKQAGWNRAQLERAIGEQLPGEFRHRAELIARTELGKLNTRVTIETYKGTGVRYYRWLTTIDGRERASHAEMNGRICSVSDGGVYYEQNPVHPLQPVEHQRTGAMYHGHPGTDFQCRCSMVMWDPEIDGDYEVRESDLIERKEAAEKAEKEAEERAEAERQAREQAERERAAESVRKAREEARQAEAGRQAAERAKEILVQANARHAARAAKERARIQERWDRRARRREIFAVAEERHDKRNAAEIQARWDKRARRREILEAAKERHRKRYDWQENATRRFWAQRVKRRKEARELLKRFEGEASVKKDIDELKEALAKADQKRIARLTAKLRKLWAAAASAEIKAPEPQEKKQAAEQKPTGKKRDTPRTKEERAAIIQRRKDRRLRSENYQWIMDRAPRIKKFEVQRLPRQLSEREIIARIAGGDKTSGSCSSLAIAYAANRAGLDVLDFRGGKSMEMFRSFETLEKIVDMGGHFFVGAPGGNEFELARKALKFVKPGKEYYFSAGEHAAIVRRRKNGIEYLELQERYLQENGFFPLDRNELASRFGCKIGRSAKEGAIWSSIIDIEQMADSPNFKKMMGYINTASDKQKKGASGHIR